MDMRVNACADRASTYMCVTVYMYVLVHLVSLLQRKCTNVSRGVSCQESSRTVAQTSEGGGYLQEAGVGGRLADTPDCGGPRRIHRNEVRVVPLTGVFSTETLRVELPRGAARVLRDLSPSAFVLGLYSRFNNQHAEESQKSNGCALRVWNM